MLKATGRRIFTTSLLAGTALVANAAQAQSAPPVQTAPESPVPATPAAPAGVAPAPAGQAASSQTGTQDIIVTAEKRSTSVNKVPLSISVFNGTQLATAGVHSTEDLAKVVPGFSTVTSFYGSPVYYLRGVGYYDNSVAARPAVTIYADEAPIPYSVMAMGTTLDLERVEVLKGPQGTLFGSNSTGGAINFIAAKPGDKFEAGADLSYGRFDDFLTSGFVSGPLSDKVGLRFAVSHESSGDWQKNNVTGATLGAKNITSFRGTLTFNPVDRLKGMLTFSGTFDKSDVQVGQLVGRSPNVPPEPVFEAFPLAPHNARATAFGTDFPDGGQLQKNNRELQTTLRLDYELSDATTITSLTSGAWNRQDFGQSASATTLQVYALDRRGHIHNFSQELRAGGHFGENRGHWILGGSYEHDKTYEDTIFDIRDANAGNVFDALGLPPIDKVPTILGTRYESKGVFGNLDYDLTDALTAHAGVRYTYTGLKYNACTENAGNLTYGTGIGTTLNLTGSSIRPLVAGDCVDFAPLSDGTYALTTIRGKINQGSTSWRAGLDWKPVTGTLLYGNISRGYKAQAISNIAAVFASQYQPVPQERLTSYELGVKTDILPGTHLNAAVFYYQYADKQLQGTLIVPIFGPLATLVSVPKSHILGADFDLTTRPFRGLTLGAQGTFLKSEVDGHFIGTTELGDTSDFRGSAFPNTPKWQVAGNGEYRWSVGSNLNAFFGGRYSWKSGTYGDFTKEDFLRIKPYGLLDAYAGVSTKDKRWTFQVWGHNITNKYYWTAQNAFLESIVRYAGMPATYGASASFRF